MVSITVLTLLTSPYGYAQAPQIDLSAIATIESSGNPSAVGDGGKALGLFQIHHAVIVDYNKANSCHKALSDALDAITATQIADWYLHFRIPQILRSLKRPLNAENVIRCYNAGCGSLRKPPSPVTKRYLERYRRLIANAKAPKDIKAGVAYGGILRGIQRSPGALHSGTCAE